MAETPEERRKRLAEINRIDDIFKQRKIKANKAALAKAKEAKPQPPAAKQSRASEISRKVIGGTGCGRLVDTMNAAPANKGDVAAGRKNARGTQTPTPEEARKIQAAMKAKYQKKR